ncbi:transmembrane protein 275 [Phycodurus eques]|uniref:transmembrane protein 275 n=1 Tax=Phycodurus eques TaxID=693459 RepID=UPI002ACE14CD|nr:transmembrane protein 275 [Phycodurus eques]
MVITDRNSGAAASKKEPAKDKKRRASRLHGLPSPALCCACGLCIMLAGLNITLVGVFAFRTLVPSANPSIVIGPILLLVAFSFFGACCVCSRLPPPPHSSRGAKTGARGLNLIGNDGPAGAAAFEIETSEHTLQDTTAVQLSPTSSPASSRGSGSENQAPDGSLLGTCQLFTMETDGSPDSSGATYSASAASGGEVRLNLPREEVAT